MAISGHHFASLLLAVMFCSVTAQNETQDLLAGIEKLASTLTGTPEDDFVAFRDSIWPFIRIYELNPRPINVIIDARDLPIVIRSPNFGRGNYPNNVNYTLTIRSLGEPLVLVFFFRYFDVEYQRNCAYDALSLRGIKYCGTWEAGRSIPFFLPEYDSIAVNFKTDATIVRPGFELIVIPEQTVREQIEGPVKGL